LYAIASRQLAGEWRVKKREAPSVEIESATSNDPNEAIWLRRAVSQLSEEQREVLLLREYEQLSYDEIASLLRIPLNTVRSRLFRARMELKTLLSPERKGHEGSRS
jgi:RNA polymerase sigma-70 factor, ECF subfamily